MELVTRFNIQSIIANSRMNGTSPTINGLPLGQALPSGTQLEEFIIERVLGSGGFGITYLARDKRLGRQVVIKENLPAQFCWRDTMSLKVQPRQSSGEDADNFQYSLESFETEAATLASLDHPGIVKVLRSFEANGTAYFVMPFVEGVTFDEVIKERQAQCESFTEEELIGLLRRVLEALGYLHERGIYHRDIKPGNILITAEGDPVLIDFGAARQRLSERSLTVIESPGYTPFEQLQSRGKVGPWSDLYALGGTLYKAITGETPEKSADRVMEDSLLQLAKCTDLSNTFSHRFLESLDQALAFKVRDRFQDADSWRRWIGDPMPLPLSSLDDQSNLLLSKEGGVESSLSGEQWQSLKPIQEGERNESVLSTPLSIPIVPSIIALIVIFIGSSIQAQATSRSSVGGFQIWIYTGITQIIIVGASALVFAALVGGFCALFKVPFMKAFSRAYSATVLIVSLGMLIISFAVLELNSKSRMSPFDVSKAKVTVSELEDDIRQFQARGDNPNRMSSEQLFQSSNSSAATTDLEKVRDILRSCMQDIVTLQGKYERELADVGIESLMDSHRVAADPGLIESSAILLKLRQTAERYREMNKAMLEDIPNKIRAYSYEHTTKGSLVEGFEKGLHAGLSKYDQIWNLELEVLDHCAAALKLVESNRSRWTPKDGTFVFELDADLNLFNSIMEEITRCVEEQDEIRQSSMNSAMEKVDRMKAKL
jgi:serine/threonine protein kinase